MPNIRLFYTTVGFSGGSVGEEIAYNVGDSGNVGLIPRSGRSPGGRHSNPLQYSCLENPWMGPGNLQSKGLQRAGHD